MLRDTIQNVPDDFVALGARVHTHRYNNFDFKLEVKAHPSTNTTNDRARRLSVLNMEANIRKSAAGLGHGQYLKPEEIANLQSGKVMLSTTIAGKHYNIPIAVSPRGEYSSEILKGRFNSLQDISAKVMDGILMHNGIDNMYVTSSRSSMRSQMPATAPAQSGFGMRM
ncbi:hypothetical protein [Rhizobium sp. BK176]|uniref:hypothetical protein n=1 Tax=Rhizobium sp. BK176 TaxID=2587071 RepID=UPI0021679423|nr:hypothetical protein [Rhizobium sp. BK176]MCS4088910.1 hypothetical protein [Rhizobium sp. BK176]